MQALKIEFRANVYNALGTDIPAILMRNLDSVS